MVCEDTLRIKNIPKDLTDTEIEDFLRHFGAQNVKIVTSNTKLKTVAFAKFESKQIAKAVLHRLHQIDVLNSRLCVEFAEHDRIYGKVTLKHLENLDKPNKKHFRTFVNKLNAFNSAVSFNQPPPNHLKYVYPKPNRATIGNIAHALASVPKFYTQVLHLMNKMNLPPPFSNIPDLPQVSDQQVIQTTPVTASEPVPIVAPENSSESEMESDTDTQDKKEIIPVKRNLPQKKIVKRPKFIKPLVAQVNHIPKASDKTDEVFEKTNLQQYRKIELKVSLDTLDQKLNSESTEPEKVGTFGILLPLEKPDVPDSENIAENQENAVISAEELETNRIPPQDLSVLPVFKDYRPGVPTCRLYIKNISKTVVLKDLEYIYKRYNELQEDCEKPNQFDIRLMQEGRMKGQAFVTLESVDLAQKALTETNGYILKDKPLVVVFARSALPKK